MIRATTDEVEVQRYEEEYEDHADHIELEYLDAEEYDRLIGGGGTDPIGVCVRLCGAVVEQRRYLEEYLAQHPYERDEEEDGVEHSVEGVEAVLVGFILTEVLIDLIVTVPVLVLVFIPILGRDHEVGVITASNAHSNLTEVEYVHVHAEQ